MEEDVLGTMRTVNPSPATTYVECARCSKMVSQEDARVVPSTALDNVSEYEHLCASCYEALTEGEQDLLTPES